MSDRRRVLVVAHGHPDRSPGGGEIAALALHRALRDSDDLDSVLLTRHDDPFPTHQGTAFAGNGRPAEISFHTRGDERFLFTQLDPSRVWTHFRDVLEIVRPDIVHFHHYLHLGLELIGEVRRFDSRVAIAMTLHDFHAICHNEGQMVRTRTGALCPRATAPDCQRCFPSRTVQDFALRERYVKGWLARVDRFVAPSEFLAGRYADWGIGRSRIEVLENLLEPIAERTPPTAAPAEDRPPAESRVDARHPGAPLRLAFFGRINAIKGVDLLLAALLDLPEEVRARVRLDLHGAGLERQPLVDRRALRRAARRLGTAVRFRGAYRRDELPALMSAADWMIVPSRWWENSPVVILEARRHGLPVICADIGGMREKIEHRVTGLHFRAGDARALAERIAEVAELDEPARLGYAERIARSVAAEATRARHLELHRELLRGRDEEGRSEPMTRAA